MHKLRILSVDPGRSTGVVALEVSSRGLQLVSQVLHTSLKMWRSPELSRMLLPAVWLDQRSIVRLDLVVEAPPVRPHDQSPVIGFTALETLARDEGWSLHAYSPGQWKPIKKRTPMPPLASAHIRDAYVMACYHLRQQHAQLPFLKEPTWSIPLSDE